MRALRKVVANPAQGVELEARPPGVFAPCRVAEQIMHLQQAKLGKSGGPQYWLQQAPAHILEHIRRHRKCQVILQTPYGPVETPFNAVDPDHKIVEGRIVKANAQHFRIQKGESKDSIGEAIRHWFALDADRDFERIEIKITFDSKSRFILAPIEVHWRKGSPKILPSTEAPLSFNARFESELWKEQIKRVWLANPDALAWTASQFKRFLQDYTQPKLKLVSEADLLRLAGAFDHLGLRLGSYLLKGYDCPTSSFCFGDYPEYSCPVEIKKRASGFKYQIKNYPTLPRAVVLCLDYDTRHPHEHVDFVEVRSLARFLSP
jgi:hypothetical protein